MRIALLIMILFIARASMAQSTDSIVLHSPVRTLTDRQYTAWVKGTDPRDMAFVAELNHFPLPDKIVQYKKELDLSPAQIIKINDVIKFLKMKKAEIGQSVVRNEKMLDSMFRTRKLDEGSVIYYANRYGLYEGEYRTAMLQACIRTENVLTPQQIRKFEQLEKHN